MYAPARSAVLVAVAAAVFLTGCADTREPTGTSQESSETVRSAETPRSPGTAAPAQTSEPPRSPPPSASTDTPAPGPTPSDGRPTRATLSIPAIGINGLVVQPYRGWTDDGPGTDIQNDGRAASPHGPRGGTGPGGVGNYQVTAHRNSSTAAFFELPALRTGQRVHVHARGVRYTYAITTTRETSFRSPRSLAEQRAPVPGRPGAEPTRAMITLSTCATQEDHAAGNFWADEFDNPEHRIDKIGVLVRTAQVPA